MNIYFVSGDDNWKPKIIDSKAVLKALSYRWDEKGPLGTIVH